MFAKTLFPPGVLAAAMLASGAALAQISDDVVKIGVLTDMNGPASTPTGQGSVTAAQMAIDDFGGKVLGKPISRGRRRSSIEAGHRQRNRAALVRCRAGRPDRGRAGVGRRPRGAERRQRKEETVHHPFDRRGGFSRQVLFALRDAMGVRHPRARGRHRAGGGQARRRQLVLHHRRLRVRAFAGTRRLGRDHQERRQGARLGAAAVCNARSVVVHPAGAGLESQDHRHRRGPAEQHERDQDRRRVRRLQGRAADGGAARADHRHPFARPAGGARACC